MIYEDYKFVAIVNKRIESGVALNAVAHCVAGLVDSASDELREKMSFIDFIDKDKTSHKNISALSLIVLRGTSGEIKKARNSFIDAKIHYTDFIETMTGDSYKEQLEKTFQTSSDDLNYFCTVAFGLKDNLDPITGKLSLWR